jgi:hypothetical protein
MALSIDLTGVPRKVGEPTWGIDNVVWPPHVLERDSRFRQISLDQGYVDFLAVLTVDEALEINSQYLDWKLEHWERKNRELQLMLETRRVDTDFVVVHVYEWETGMND